QWQRARENVELGIRGSKLMICATRSDSALPQLLVRRWTCLASCQLRYSRPLLDRRMTCNRGMSRLPPVPRECSCNENYGCHHGGKAPHPPCPDFSSQFGSAQILENSFFQSRARLHGSVLRERSVDHALEIVTIPLA